MLTTALVGTVVLPGVLGHRNSVNSQVCSPVFLKVNMVCSPTWALNCRDASVVSMIRGANFWDSCVHLLCAYDMLIEF